uniref:pentatricopeptide repeat-containing protein At5g65560-like n=1 Tax=Erigeron canadensis TaxID=72917 RepID=UPI001CB9BB7B|nr:pentatricopeptide repeat-containing protein At5g65560-like [Erigeron canadensis]
MELFWKVYEKMLSNKDIRPDDLTYNNLIDAYVRDGTVKEAKKLFFQIVKNKAFTPSLVTYNVLISELCKIGYVLTAFKIKKSMKNKGLKTDRCAYNNLIVGLCKRKRTQDAKLLFNEMAFKIKDETVAQGLEASFDKPTIKAYTYLLRSYIKSRDKAKIFTFVRDLTELGIPKNQVLPDLLLDGFSNEYSFEKTLKLLDELVAKELCCRSIFDRLLYYFCKKGKFYEAMACIDEVKQRVVTISPDTCKALAAGLKNRGYKPTMMKQ